MENLEPAKREEMQSAISDAGLSVIDIIKTDHQYMVGETHPNGVFGVRGTSLTLSGAWADALFLSKRYGLAIKVVSHVVTQELIDAGMIEDPDRSAPSEKSPGGTHGLSGKGEENGQ